MQAPDGLFAGFFPPQKICIIGAGQFGYLAAQRLSRRFPEASFLVADQREEKLERVERDFGLPVFAGDFLEFPENPWVDDKTWIIPAVPIHFAFQWVLNDLKKTGRAERLPMPETVEAHIPNPYRAANGSLCASFATFICPDYCNEPDEICTYTKSPRQGNLFEELAKIKVPGFDTIVVRSWQLAPGVGGYPRDCLMKVSERIVEKPEGYCLIATSCRCHGVIDALRWTGAHAR